MLRIFSNGVEILNAVENFSNGVENFSNPVENSQCH